MTKRFINLLVILIMSCITRSICNTIVHFEYLQRVVAQTYISYTGISIIYYSDIPVRDDKCSRPSFIEIRVVIK